MYVHTQTGKIFEKSSAEECTFDYITLHIKCRFNKNSLLLSDFLVIFAGWEESKKHRNTNLFLVHFILFVMMYRYLILSVELTFFFERLPERIVLGTTTNQFHLDEVKKKRFRKKKRKSYHCTQSPTGKITKKAMRRSALLCI